MSDNLTQAISDFFQDSSISFEAADIFCFGKHDSIQRLASLVGVLSCLRRRATSAAFEIHLLLPRFLEDQATALIEAVLEGAEKVIEDLYDRPLSKEEKDNFSGRVHLHVCQSLETSSLVRTLSELPSEIVVIVLHAAKYRAAEVKVAPARQPEDVWVHHVTFLAGELNRIAKDCPRYVILDTEESLPLEDTNSQTLQSVEESAVLGIRESDNPLPQIVENYADWQRLMDEGHVGIALQSIDTSADLSDSQKVFLKACLLDKAGLRYQAMESVREIIRKPEQYHPDSRVRLARIAEAAGERDIAGDLLRSAISEASSDTFVGLQEALSSQGVLVEALDLSSRLDDADSEAKILVRLSALFPNSESLLYHQIYNYLHKHDIEGLGSFLDDWGSRNQSELAACFQKVVDRLSVSLPDYNGLLDEVVAEWPRFETRIRLVCIQDALWRGAKAQWIELALALDTRSKLPHDVALRLVDCIERLLLEGQGDDSDLEVEQILTSLMSRLTSCVAQDPTDSVVRNWFMKLLSPQTSGLLGISILVSLVLREVKALQASRKSRLRFESITDYEETDVRRSLLNARKWLGENDVFMLQNITIPPQQLTVPVDALLSLLVQVLHESGKSLLTQEEIRDFEGTLVVAVVLARQSKNIIRPIDILRLGAATLLAAGRAQRARDLIETAFAFAGEDEELMRFAWISLADIYLRLSKMDESLMALCCAFSYQVDITPEHAWVEVDICIRLLRELHLCEQSRELIPLARGFLHATRVQGGGDLTANGLTSDDERRLEYLDLGLRFQQLLDSIDVEDIAGDDNDAQRSELNPEMSSAVAAVKFSKEQAKELSDIAMAVTQLIDSAQNDEDEILPLVQLLSHVIYVAKRYRCTLPPGTPETLNEALDFIGEPFKSYVTNFAMSNPSIETLAMLFNQTEIANYSEDRGYDLNQLAALTRRLLDSSTVLDDPVVTSYALELLTDHAIGLHGPAPSTAERDFQFNIEQVGPFMEKVSCGGITVALIGLSEAGQLVRVSAEDGQLSSVQIEPSSRFSIVEFSEWQEQYPYGYAEMNDINNAVRLSMGKLQCLPSVRQRTLLVADTELQQLPPNLILVDDEFIGIKWAIAVTPSLSWLHGRLESTYQRTTKRRAWIPAVSDAEGINTLELLTDGVQSTLDEHGLVLSKEREIPVDLANSELVIIGAHGGLSREKQYFQAVSDQNFRKVGVFDLARAIEDVRLVILFVCSGGRVDKHPLAHTTIGLVKDLLDRGCSTVIAPPWPVHVMVPPVWLAAFMESWDSGEMVIDANFHANRAVAGARENSPADCLAMTVYGNPFVTK